MDSLVKHFNSHLVNEWQKRTRWNELKFFCQRTGLTKWCMLRETELKKIMSSYHWSRKPKNIRNADINIYNGKRQRITKENISLGKTLNVKNDLGKDLWIKEMYMLASRYERLILIKEYTVNKLKWNLNIKYLTDNK